MADTKSCMLTEDEIECLIKHHGFFIKDGTDTRIERINYLNRRSKAFKEEGPDVREPKPKPEPIHPNTNSGWNNA